MSILISSDVDGTALPWKKGEFQTEVNEVAFQSNKQAFSLAGTEGDTVVLNTGASRPVFQRAKKWTEQISYQYLACNNGSTLYKKTEAGHERMQGWEEYLEKTYHWSVSKVNQAMGESLKALRFKKITRQEWPFKPYSGTSVFYRRGLIPHAPRLNRLLKTHLYAELDPDGKVITFNTDKHGSALRLKAMRIITKKFKRNVLKALNDTKVKAIEQAYPVWDVFVFDHEQIGKKAVTQFLANLVSAKAIVTMDDHNNGTDMLEPQHYTLENGTEVPNYAIVTGDNIDFNAVKAKNPRAIKTKHHGNIGDALTQQRRLAEAECGISRTNTSNEANDGNVA